MVDTPTTYDALQSRKNELVRKALEGSVFIAPMSSDLITNITDASGALIELPAGYTDIGWVDQSDGVTWSRKTDTDDTDAWGAVQPVRSDINSVASSVKFTMLETKRSTLELYYGLDLSAVTPDASSGEVSFEEPDRPATNYFRMLGLFVDGAGDNTIFVARLYSKANVTDIGDQKWSSKGSTVSYDVTCQSNISSADGYSVKHFFGGPGWQALEAELGFSAGS